MDAAHHWDVLAGKAVDRIAEEVSAGETIAVERQREQPFDRAFADLLTTRLTEAGLRVAPGQANDVTVTYNAQVIRHGKLEPDFPPGFFTAATGAFIAGKELSTSALTYGALPVGAVATDVLRNRFRDRTTREVLVSVSVRDDGAYRARFSKAYYVGKDDVPNYGERRKDKETRRFSVVDGGDG